MKIMGRIVCMVKGHKRGKSVGTHTTAKGKYTRFACPRCGGNVKTRKVKEAKE